MEAERWECRDGGRIAQKAINHGEMQPKKSTMGKTESCENGLSIFFDGKPRSWGCFDGGKFGLMLRFADALPMVKTLPVVACLGHAGEKRGKGQLAWTLALSSLGAAECCFGAGLAPT